MSKVILTIDDSASMRQTIRVALSTAGYRVIEACDGAEGLSKATSEAVDAIITDLNMPVMNGLDFLRRFRAHPASKGVPVVLLTTENDDALKQQAREAGAIGWMVKPFSAEKLLAMVKKVAGA